MLVPSPWLRLEYKANMQNYLKYVSPDGTKLLGPTSAEEQAFCEWLTSEAFTGRAQVVELGPWLGSLTIPTARGLNRNVLLTPKSRIIHTYDMFVWQIGFEEWVRGTPHEGKFKVDDSFLSLYKEIVAPYQTGLTIVIHHEDLTLSKWNGGPIEFLINDAWKTVPIMSNIIKRFFPSLVVGATVFHQDYLFATQSYIHVAMFRLREYFEFVLRLPNSSGVVFKKRRDVPKSVINDLASRTCCRDFSKKEIKAAFNWSKGLFKDPEVQLVVDASKAWLLNETGDTGSAKRIFQDIRRSEHCSHWFYKFQEELLRQWGYKYVD